jgi:hypothetical protein
MGQQMVAEGIENQKNLLEKPYESVDHYEDVMEDWMMVKDKEMQVEVALKDWRICGNSDEEKVLPVPLTEHEVQCEDL